MEQEMIIQEEDIITNTNTNINPKSDNNSSYPFPSSKYAPMTYLLNVSGTNFGYYFFNEQKR